MSIKQWHTLACHKCAGDVFVPVYNLVYQDGLGTSPRPIGYFCVKCQEKVDQAKSVLEARKKEAEQKIKDIEASLNG